MPHQDLTVAERQTALDTLISANRVALPGDVWRRLLGTLHVPQAERQAAARHLSSILTLGAVFYGNGITPREVAAVRERLARTAAMASALVDDLMSYGIDEAANYEIRATGLDVTRNPGAAPELTVGLLENTAALRFPHVSGAIRAVADVAIIATDFTPRRIITCAREQAFPLTVGLLYQAAAETGWRLTLSHETRSGSLVDLLDAVKPHMPAGFVPEPLSMKQLRSVRAKALEQP
jgi:hypothetical protein